MPKRVFKLPSFNKGVVSNASPRDIPEDALAYAENVDSRVAGKVRGIPDNETVNTSFDARVMAAGTGSDNLLIGQDSARQFKQYDIDADSVTSVGTPTGNYVYSMAPYGNAVFAGMSDAWRAGDATEPQWVGEVSHSQFNGLMPAPGISLSHAECKNYDGGEALVIHNHTFNTVGSSDISFIVDTYYFYGFSFVYDGFQESPLLTKDANGSRFWFSPSEDSRSLGIGLIIQFDDRTEFSSRITAINVYKAESSSVDAPQDDYSFLGSLSLTSASGGDLDETGSEWDVNPFGSTKANSFYRSFTDTGGPVGASFENNSGIPESLESTYANYKIATAYGGYLFVGDCQKDGVPNASKYIYRSLPKNFSAINWLTDFAILPEVPTALCGFNGRLFAFSDSTIYRINPFTMAVEDDYAGVGSLNDRTVVASNYGMFHADSENIYINDGRTSVPIGSPIQTVQFGGNAYGWKEIAKTGSGHISSLAFDAANNRLLAFGNVDATTNICWAYDIERQQWQLYTDIDMPAGLATGTDGTLFATDGSQLKSLFTSATRKNWKIVTKDFDLGSDSGDFWAYDLQGYGEGNFTIKYLKDGSATATDPGTATVEGLRKATVNSIDKKMKSIALQIESAAPTDELDNLTVQYRPQVILE